MDLGKAIATRKKKLLGAPGIATRSDRTLLGAPPGLTTRNKKLVGCRPSRLGWRPWLLNLLQNIKTAEDLDEGLHGQAATYALGGLGCRQVDVNVGVGNLESNDFNLTKCHRAIADGDEPGAPSSFLFLVAMPGAPSSVRSLLVVRPGAPEPLVQKVGLKETASNTWCRNGMLSLWPIECRETDET